MGQKVLMTLIIGKAKVNNAFTLIEIILVLVITAVILAMALPNFSRSYSQFQLRQSVDDLLVTSRWAQAMAMGQRRVYALSFAQDRRSYRLLLSDLDESGQQKDFQQISGQIGRMHLVPPDIHLNVQADRIQFYSDGTIDPATVELASSRGKKTLSSAVVRGLLTVVDDE